MNASDAAPYQSDRHAKVNPKFGREVQEAIAFVKNMLWSSDLARDHHTAPLKATKVRTSDKAQTDFCYHLINAVIGGIILPIMREDKSNTVKAFWLAMENSKGLFMRQAILSEWRQDNELFLHLVKDDPAFNVLDNLLQGAVSYASSDSILREVQKLERFYPDDRLPILFASSVQTAIHAVNTKKAVHTKGN